MMTSDFAWAIRSDWLDGMLNCRDSASRPSLHAKANIGREKSVLFVKVSIASDNRPPI